MHEGRELAQILRRCRIETRELVATWNELFPRRGGRIPRNDMSINWTIQEPCIPEETHLQISACLRHIMEGRMSELRDYLATGIVASAARQRIDALLLPLGHRLAAAEEGGSPPEPCEDLVGSEP